VLRSFRNDPMTSSSLKYDSTSPVFAWQSTGLAPNIVGTYQGIDAPLSGAVAIYPGAVGSVTTRLFVGDSDGDLWKVDTTDTDPLKWKVELFADAHAGLTYTLGGDVPQPVTVPPVVSVDPLGNITVVMATGDQNTFSNNNRNHVLSVKETLNFATTPPTATPSVNWKLDFTGGITPTGPLSLFSGNVFFSTFSPNVATDSTCLSGEGTIWGVDYYQVEPGTSLPIARLQQQSGETIAGSCPGPYANADARVGLNNFFRCIPLTPGTIVFGSGITQRPSCVDSATTATTDPYLGGSMSHQTITDINQGSFQLVAQTGPKAGTTDTAGTTTKTFTRTLVAPVSVTRIDSWAPIIE
jgi:type IV pilus assembly protein PilY1